MGTWEDQKHRALQQGGMELRLKVPVAYNLKTGETIFKIMVLPRRRLVMVA